MSMLTDALRTALQPKPTVTLDAAVEPTLAGADDYTLADLAMKAAATIQQWAETDDLDDGETFTTRLLNTLVGIADENKDGDISDDEAAILEVVVNAAFDYLVKLGVDETDAEALLSEWDDDAGDRLRDFVASVLPEGEDESAADLDDFVFGDNDQEPALDATYKTRIAIRGGKKMRVKKRVAGTVRLSAKQKLAIRKARMKSHSAAAMMRRLKSMRMRRKMGL